MPNNISRYLQLAEIVTHLFYCTFLSVIDHNYILLRELRPDLLPGRCLWACDTPKTTVQDITAIGKGSATTMTPLPTMATTHMSLLKKLQVKGNDVNLAVEILAQPQSKVRPGPGVFRVWAQRLVNPYVTEEVCLC